MRNSQRRPLDIAGLLVDLDGVVYVGADLLPGARAAFETLDARGVPYRFITNTTRRSRVQIVEKLAVLGLPVEPGLLFTPASLAAAQLRAGRRSAFLVAADDLAADFAGCDGPDGEAVVVADAGDRFSYDMMNRAYRKLLDGAEFLALAKNRSFRDADGGLSLDAGPFVAALEFATGRQARVFGKPSPDFFAAAVAGLSCPPRRVAMIGDDVEADVAGAMACGMTGVLVRTGKYAPGQERLVPAGPSLVADDIGAAVAALLG